MISVDAYKIGEWHTWGQEDAQYFGMSLFPVPGIRPVLF